MIVGIDLGTTNSAIAYINKSGKPEIIPNREGGRTTPSVILFEDDKRVVVGEIAKENSIFDPLNVVEFIKTEMGNSDYKFYKDSISYTPEELSSIILRKLKEDAEAFLGQKVDKAVVTVPAYFNDSQRKATKDAGKIIGLDIEKIINEPTAAALAYGLNKGDTSKVLVYDLGGGTFDATLVSIDKDKIDVIATDGIRELGGRDFDDKICEYIIKIFEEKHGIDLEGDEHIETFQEVRRKVEECKKALSFRQYADIYVKCNRIREKIRVTREDFNKMIGSLYKRTEHIIDDLLDDAKTTWNNLDKILLVGGSSRVPLIAEELERKSGITVSREIHPDEAVAMGAAVQASLLGNKSEENIKVKDVTSHSIGVVSIDAKTGKRINNIVLKKNSSIPTLSKRTFFTAEDNQECIKLQITEGELEDIEYVNIIGDFEINLPKNLKKDTEIIIKITLDEEQIIHVFTQIPSVSNYVKEIHIERKSNLSNDEISKKKDIVSKISLDGSEETNGIVNNQEEIAISIEPAVENKSDEQSKMKLPRVAREMETFIGMDAVKEQIKRIIETIKFNKKREAMGLSGGVKQGYHFILTGNPGTGKSSVARVISKILSRLEIASTDKLVEVDRSGLVSQYIGQTEAVTKGKIEEAMGGVLFIDEAYALYKPNSSKDPGLDCINTLMKEMEDKRGDFSVIMAGYKNEMDTLMESNPGLKSRFNYDIHIPDYSDDELIEIAVKMAYDRDFVISEEGKKAIRERINQLRVDENFGNARVARQLIDEAIQRIAERLAGTDFDEKEAVLLRACDFGVNSSKTEEEIITEALEELNNLIGLDDVKTQVNSIVNTIKVEKKRAEYGMSQNGLPALHMMFLGNPGTGKTTVARIIGRIYKALGILKRGDVFIECSRSDLVGQHLGETSIKTEKLVKSALGGILFIDEAYTLYQGGNDSFGKEAIGALIKEMEDKRDKLMVILAGYPKEMDEMLSANSGFISRINTTINFEDYKSKELLEIFKIMCKGKGFEIEEDAIKLVAEKLDVLYKNRSDRFGNGRDVRNIFEKIIQNQNNRLAQQMIQGLDVIKEINKIRITDIQL